MMKKLTVLFMAACLLLAGCGNTQDNSGAASSDVPASSGAASVTQTVSPLPDATMENTTDAILSVSLQQGGAYVDDNGQMQMDLTVYTYDQYDMVDIANLQVGDTIITHAGAVEVTSKEQDEVSGAVVINGGLEEGGFDLFTDESGIYYEKGFNDVKSWYQVGTVTIPVSADFEGVDSSDLDQGEVVIYPGDFLNGTVTNYDFTPYNTTVRIEDGKVVELTRWFTP